MTPISTRTLGNVSAPSPGPEGRRRVGPEAAPWYRRCQGGVQYCQGYGDQSGRPLLQERVTALGRLVEP